MNEKHILTMTDSPFIIKLFATYNGSQHLYFLLEPALGGELFAIYHRKSLHGSEKHAKFYTACVVKGFEHLHERRIIYRDLKPENLLLNEKGFCKITDMGLAKFVIGRTYTTCGTPDYFAPEVIQSTGHTKAVDWWTLGIMVYELMSGHPPFESSDPQRTYAKVMQGIDRARWNQPCFKPEIEALVKSLCKRDPSERLPMRPGGVQNLITQAWYKDFDWAGLVAFTAKPPYVPKVKDPSDMSNFHAHEEDLPPHIPYTDPGTGWDKDFAMA
jgi:cGMP-dependent protein kinase